MSHQLFQDDIAASMAWKATALELADNQLKQVAARYASPIAKQNAEVLSAQLQATKAKFNADLKIRLEELGIKRQANAIDAMKAATAAHAGPGAATRMKVADEVKTASENILRNANELKTLIKAYGTQEKLTPGVEGGMERRSTEIATELAKMLDPETGVRDAEMERWIQRVFSPGYGQRDAAALAELDDLISAVKQRRDTALRIRGMQ